MSKDHKYKTNNEQLVSIYYGDKRTDYKEEVENTLNDLEKRVNVGYTYTTFAYYAEEFPYIKRDLEELGFRVKAQSENREVVKATVSLNFGG